MATFDGHGNQILSDPASPAELARRQAICFDCEYTSDEGCQKIEDQPWGERKRLTLYKQSHGHCSMCCNGETPRW
jgi:hypothetical protein